MERARRRALSAFWNLCAPSCVLEVMARVLLVLCLALALVAAGSVEAKSLDYRV